MKFGQRRRNVKKKRILHSTLGSRRDVHCNYVSNVVVNVVQICPWSARRISRLTVHGPADKNSCRFSRRPWPAARDLLASAIDPPGSITRARETKKALSCREADPSLTRVCPEELILHPYYIPERKTRPRGERRGGGRRSKSTGRETLLSVGTDYSRRKGEGGSGGVMATRAGAREER